MSENSRYSFLPIRKPRLIKHYYLQRDSFWTPVEICYATDRKDWDELDNVEYGPDIKHFIEFILCFFAQADGIVNENLIENFKKETSMYKEAGYFYAAQELMEVIHNETYSNLIETFIRNEDDKNKAFNAIDEYPSIKAIADWAFEWMDTKPERYQHRIFCRTCDKWECFYSAKAEPTNVKCPVNTAHQIRPDSLILGLELLPIKPPGLLHRVIAFACIEGVFFTGAFASIYWIKKKNILQGLCKANEFIARDEGIHRDFAIDLYHQLVEDGYYKPLSQKEAELIIISAIETIEFFIRDALRVDLIGMSVDNMVDYTKCVADSLLECFGFEKLYNVTNPFEWMAMIAIPNKTNFFEGKVTEYAKPKESDFEFDQGADF